MDIFNSQTLRFRPIIRTFVGYDRPRNSRPHLCRRQYRRYRRRVRHAQTQGRELCRLLSVPQREDPLVRRFPLEGTLQVLRMREGWECRHLRHGTGVGQLSRGPQDGGQTLRNRGARGGPLRRGAPPQRRPRVDVRPQQLGRRLFRQLPPPRQRGNQRRTLLFPAETEPDRRHDQKVRTRVLPLEGRPDVEGCPRGRVQAGVPPLDGSFAGP